MMIRAVLLIIVATAALALGGLVLSKSRRDGETRWWFFVLCLCVAVWSIGLEAFLLSESPRMLDIASRWFYAASAAFCPAVVIFTIRTFLTITAKLRRFMIFGASAMILAVLYIIFVPEFIVDIDNIAIVNSHSVAINPVQYALFATFFCGFFVTAIGFGYYIWRRSKGLRRKQILAYTAGLLITSLPGFVANLILPAIGEYSFVWIGPLATIIFLLAIMYDIIRYRLLDVKSALAHGVSYAMLLTTLAAIYVVLAYVVSGLILYQDQGAILSDNSFLGVALALVLALLFQPAKHFFDNLIDKLFYHNEPKPEDFSREVGKVLTQTSDLQLLARKLSHYIADVFSIEKVSFCIPNKGVYGPSGLRRRFVFMEDIDRIMNYYRKNYDYPEAIVVKRVKDPEMKKILNMHKTEIILPLIHQDRVVGMLFLGSRKNMAFSARDIIMLESITSELAVSVRNALSMEEVRELNENLRQRVNEATNELRLSNRQLQKLDQAKSDFISMASHQLRTPLTSIKGYLDMLIEGDLGAVSGTQKAVLREMFTASERMVRLINDFLNLSRLQTGKFVVDKQLSGLDQIVREEVALLKGTADQRSVRLKVTIDRAIPKIQIDVEKMRQVVLNMIDNAIFYSKPSSVVELLLTKKNGYVEFIVKDKGIGVPKDEQSNLFGRFFRASNAKQRRPDGTGVGLFLAKKIILSHDGEMIFESEEGKGSTFGFRIPIC